MKKIIHLIASIISLAFAFTILISVAYCTSEENKNTVTAGVTKVSVLTTSNNPNYYTTFKINGGTITATGCYKSDSIKKIEMKNSGSKTSSLKAQEDGTFTAILYPNQGLFVVDEIAVYLRSGVSMTYRIEYSDGWYFPDNGLGQKNRSKFDNIQVTSPMAWANYISDTINEAEVIGTLQKVKSLSDEIVQSAKATTGYDKAIALAEWVSENIYYDVDASKTSVSMKNIAIHNVLDKRRTVCGGFANLYACLLEAQNIDCLNLKGSSTSNDITYADLPDAVENHEWTAVFIDGKWIYVDCCWNSGNRYENGEAKSGNCYLKYFDISDLAFSMNHRVDKIEKRYYFRADEYFAAEVSDTTTSDVFDSTSSKTAETTETSSETKGQETDSNSNPVPGNSGINSADNVENDITPLLVIIIIVLLLLAAVLATYLYKNTRK